jgi:putative inorganic carbon (hco3(-)) transporter
VKVWLERIFLLLIFSLGFMQPGIWFSGMSLQVTEVIFTAVVVFFGIAAVFGSQKIEWDRSFLYLGAFGLAMGLSAMFSSAPSTSAVKLLGIAYVLGLAVLTINVVTSADSIRRVVLVWLAASTLVSLIGVTTVLLFYVDRTSPWHELFLHHYGSLPPGNYPRIQSTFIFPSMLCNYLTVGVLLALGVWKTGWISKPIAFVILLLHGIAAAFTVTPGLGGFLFAILVWTGWLTIERRSHRIGRLAIAGGLAAVVGFTLISAISIRPIETSPFTFELFGTRLDPTQRMLTWQGAADTFLADPIFGKGIGQGVARVIFKAPSGQMQMLTDAHNTWLSVAAQAGIIGLASIVALSLFVMRRGWALAAQTPGADIWIYRGLLIGFVSCFLLQGLVGSFEDARHLWVLMGLIFAAYRIKLIEPSN